MILYLFLELKDTINPSNDGLNQVLLKSYNSEGLVYFPFPMTRHQIMPIDGL